ncbi:MAG TPA: helix-turn-helix domain-containing protein [Mycobacteriales bacterium]|jgi:tetratricopeptide (TPR) repeat protein|nr:helix-turn-helix domain-containing protein [Mycobacteriales bacterium]
MDPSAPHPIPDPLALGRRVRELRQRRGLKQSELALDRLSTAYVSRIESGQRRPERDVVEFLAERLGTTAAFLLTGIGRDEMADARLKLRYAELALHSGDAVEAERLLRALLDDKSLPLGHLRPDAEFSLARAMETQGRLDDAIHVLERLRANADVAEPLEVAIALSRCYRESGDLSRAVDVGEQAMQLAEELRLRGTDDAVKLTVTLAAAYFERGDTAHAHHLCQTAVEESEASSSPAARAAAYWNASAIASERGQLPTSVALAERALALLGETMDDRSLSRLRLELGSLLLRADPPDVERAQRTLARARAGLLTVGTAYEVARCDGALALVEFHRGDLDEAERLARSAREDVSDSAPRVAAGCDIVLGRIAWARGDHDAARDRYRAAVVTLAAHEADRSMATVWYELGDLLDQAGDMSAARDAYRSAAACMGLRAERTISREIRV